MTTDTFIDELVAALRTRGAKIEPRDNTAQVEEFEHELGRRLPESYRSLVTRYGFVAFDIGGITLFGTEPSEEFEAVHKAALQDRALYDVISAAGFIPIGRPDTGSYDPICFDGRRAATNHEYRMVRLDHEAALSWSRAEVAGGIAESFSEFVRRHQSGG